MSTLDTIREAIRQEVTEDSNFYKKFVYYFELRIPSEVALLPFMNTFVFPLALNPENYVLEEPFALEKTFTQGGGLYIEENGIVERMIRISGTTGFKPRKLKGGGPSVFLAKTPESKSHGRELLALVFDKLSGQRHFHYLQDVVFRTYADYKRDPATSDGTQLIFHNPKDQEHWLVAPEKFTLERAGRSPLYRYSIDLLVLGPADDIDADFSEDKSLIDEFKDAVRTIKGAIDLASGAINDLTALADEIARTIKDIGKIFDSVGTFLDAAGDFVNGVTELIEAPYAIIESVNGLVNSALDLADTISDAKIDDVPPLHPWVVSKFVQVMDAMDLAGTQPQVFEQPINSLVRAHKQREELALSVSSEELAEAELASPPASLDEVNELGTSITPGDVESAKADLAVGRETGGYTGAQEVSIGKGDTMVNLASRYLGDARLWTEIATLNGMKPPYIDEQAGADLGGEETPFPGAFGIGGKILIPNYSKPPQSLPLLPVLGVIPEKSVEEHLLGTDFALEAIAGAPGRELYDFIVDIEGGSLDAKHVSGVANISQAFRMRMKIEKGTDTMYVRMGLRRTIGLKIIPVDLETSRFNLTECIRQDPRTASVRHISFEQETDAVIADMDVELRGFTKPTNVKTVV
jgi:hypothetical protein